MRLSGQRAADALLLTCALAGGPARAANQAPIVMKITLPTINEFVHACAKALAAAVEKDSGGRIKAEVYPASQLGSIPRQIEGVQFGSIQVAMIPPEFFSGVDPRFAVLAAPGLVETVPQSERVAIDPAVTKVMLGLGADKGLHGAAFFAALPSFLISKSAVRHLADFKGKKFRVLASDFQTRSLERLGASPVAMTLGDVLPAIQQGTIDGAVSGMTVYTSMHYQDAAKYVTRTGQPFIFIMVEISEKWRQSLPADLRKIVDDDAAKQAIAINPLAEQNFSDAQKEWTQSGGELIDLPPDEQAEMIKELSAVAADVAGKNPAVAQAYQTVAAAAKLDK